MYFDYSAVFQLCIFFQLHYNLKILSCFGKILFFICKFHYPSTLSPLKMHLANWRLLVEDDETDKRRPKETILSFFVQGCWKEHQVSTYLKVIQEFTI